MVYVNVRHTITNYETWRPFFDQDDARRRTAGATGVPQLYRDVDNANVITVIIEWDNAENARKFMSDPALGEVMQKAGVVGMPTVAAVTTRL
jgi:hypothetical protein